MNNEERMQETRQIRHFTLTNERILRRRKMQYLSSKRIRDTAFDGLSIVISNHIYGRIYVWTNGRLVNYGVIEITK